MLIGNQTSEMATIDSAALLWCDSSPIWIQTANYLYLVVKGRALFLPSGQEFAVRSDGVSEYNLLPIVGAGFDLEPHAAKLFRVSKLLDQLLLYESKSRPSNGRHFKRVDVINLIIDEVNGSESDGLFLTIRPDGPVRVALELVIGAAGIKVRDIAAAASMSKRTLERRFQSELSANVGAWIQKYYLLLGFESVARGKTIRHASLHAGYKSQSAFVASFGRNFGSTPGRYMDICT